MPQSSQSPASSVRPRRVTEVIARHQVGSMAVCRKGSDIAVHCQTRSGVVVLLVTEFAFTKACRSAVDSNGNPYRTVDEIYAGLPIAAVPASMRSAAPAKPSHQVHAGMAG